MSRQRIILLASLALAAGITGCTNQDRSSDAQAIWPTEEWQTSSPEAQGMDSSKLNEMMELIDERDAPIHSVLVIRHGRLVFERYGEGYDEDSSHQLQSVTKSFTSTLVGIAIQEGFIEDVDQRVIDFFPERTIANLDSRKQSMSLEHLLTMSDGMDWHEVDLPYTHPDNSLGQMWKRDDVVQHVLDQPMAREPGEAWNYNSGTSILLGNIVEQVSDQSVLQFARERLFEPIGIKHLYWAKADRNHYHTDGGLYMIPRDMARLGYLMLNDGEWDGDQILPPGWVESATSTHHLTQAGQAFGYGYQWWTLPQQGIYMALGHYDQAIYVIPEADMVVVFTADVPDQAVHPETGLLLRYILGACSDLPREFTVQTYADYGFSFQYGPEFMVSEHPPAGGGQVSETAGMVQFGYASYPVEIVNIWWDDSVQDLDAEAFLGHAFASMSEEEQEALVPGDSTQAQIGDRELEARYFRYTLQGIPLRGLVTAWPCDASDRAYGLVYITDTELSDRRLLIRFSELFEPFACGDSS